MLIDKLLTFILLSSIISISSIKIQLKNLSLIRNNAKSKISFKEKNLTNFKKVDVIETGPIGCQEFTKQTFFAHRGGNINLFQENTQEIFLDSATKNLSIEMDIMQLATGEIVTFHDLDTFKKTGISHELKKTPWPEIRNLRLLQNMDEKLYLTKPKIPLLKDVLNTICLINNRINIWFDIKYYFNPNYIIRLLDDLENSPCACDSYQKFVFEIFKDTNTIKNVWKLMENRRCKLISAMSVYTFQNDLGIEKLKDEIKNYIEYADIIDFPISTVKKYPELLKFTYENGVCNSVYKENEEDIDNKLLDEIAKYPHVDMVIYDFIQ